MAPTTTSGQDDVKNLSAIQNGVSIVICCHNSSKRLPEALRHLALQAGTENIPWEVIVVDNASIDDTSNAACRSWPSDAPVPLRVVSEPHAGLSHARFRGIRESKYELVSLVDDDNWVASDWVARVYNVLSSKHSVAACGGIGDPVFENPGTPPWFWRYASAFAVGPQGRAEGFVSRNRAFLYGAGLTVRRSAWQTLTAQGFVAILSDRKGRSLTAGGDSELCHAFVLAGWELWYDPDLKFRHFLPAERLTWSYLRRLHRGFGAAATWLDLYKLQLNPPVNVAFRRVPLPKPVCAAIRRTWAFKVYSIARTLFSEHRTVWKHRRDPAWEGRAEILRLEWELGRAIYLLKVAFVYDRTLWNLQKAPWVAKTGRAILEP